MSNASEILSEPVNIVFDIPSNWNRRKLVDLCTPKQWKTISQHEMTRTGYPVFGANGFIGFYPEYNHEYATIAVTCRGATCGTVNLIPEKTYITGNSMCFDNVSIETDVKYLFYATSFRTLSDVISGSAQPQITGESLQFVILPIPPLTEQKKIASILTSVDEVIENTQRQIDKLQELKKATMNELLTKGIGHTEFKDSELGRIPKSWEAKQLGEVIKFTGGAQPPRSTFIFEPREGYVRLLQIRDYKSDKFQTFIPEELSRRECSEDDVLIGRYGPPIFQILRGKSGSYNVALIKAEPKQENLLKGYMFHFLTRSDLFHLIDSLSQRTSGQTGIDLDALKSFDFPLPTCEEQSRILGVLDCIDAAISTRSSRLAQTQSLKKSLMQDLLTGKVRVQV